MEWIIRVNTKTGRVVKEKASREESLPPMNSVDDLSLGEMRRIWEVKIPENVF